MPFSGKATYTAGSTLPEIAEDVTDLVSISSPFETPLLDALGDPARPARSTVHEWLEDSLLSNTATVGTNSFTDAVNQTTFIVTDATQFNVGDQIRADDLSEVMLVTAINTGSNTLTVVRGYGATTKQALDSDMTLRIFGNAALEGADAAAARFRVRTRKSNFTQIFASTVEVSGSELAVRQIGVADELDYQKQQRTRELLRDLENSVINGRAPAATQEGSSTIRRTMRGIIASLTSNYFVPGSNGFSTGASLTEDLLNEALRRIWTNSAGNVDLIVVGGPEKRAINQFVAANRQFTPQSTSYRDMVSTYESDFGVCRIALSRWMPAGAVLLLDSSRIEVLPLAGRSFHYKPLAVTGDKEAGQIVGEYTVEIRNEAAHGMIQF